MRIRVLAAVTAALIVSVSSTSIAGDHHPDLGSELPSFGGHLDGGADGKYDGDHHFDKRDDHPGKDDDHFGMKDDDEDHHGKDKPKPPDGNPNPTADVSEDGDPGCSTEIGFLDAYDYSVADVEGVTNENRVKIVPICPQTSGDGNLGGLRNAISVNDAIIEGPRRQQDHTDEMVGIVISGDGATLYVYNRSLSST